VPVKVVEARYGGQLLEEAAGELIERTLHEAIGTQKLRPAGGTRVQHKPLARGQGLQYTAEFEIYPEITRLDLIGVEIERPVAPIDDADVERTVDNLRRQRITWKSVDRAAQKEDRLIIDFVGRLNGAEFEGGKADNYTLVLGSGTLLEALEQGLINARSGETRNIPVQFPADFRNPALAGQTVDFEVRVNDISEPVLPPIDDEFVRTLGIDGGAEKLRAEVRVNLEREADNRARGVLRRNVLKALHDANQFEVPKGLIDAEVERLKRLSQAMSTQTGAPVPPLDDSMYRSRAKSRVALGLVLAEIVRARGIKADPARVRARVEDMAKDYDAPAKFIEWYYANPERLGEIESSLLEERIVDELISSAKVRDRTVAFPELLKMDVSID
jgi:trigger factor